MELMGRAILWSSFQFILWPVKVVAVHCEACFERKVALGLMHDLQRYYFGVLDPVLSGHSFVSKHFSGRISENVKN